MVHMWGLTLAEGLGYMIYIILGYKSATILKIYVGKHGGSCCWFEQ